ncbi:MAG: zinc-binding alcohol dehydrogenase family protein [Alphaproteobacteria bacterium]|nr:MAG: zinc-binding alcohol dehydrogenase family protein [Alphaproteobacteria bacterium]
MRAVGYRKSLPIEDPAALLDLEIDKPAPQGRDLLVQVKAVSVNPVDYKMRKRAEPKEGEPPKILGYDATGVVAAVGPAVTLFKPGDEVWYAGSIIRPGTNSEFHLVDERIVGRKPTSLGFAAAAALPLTSITAWEMLFDRFAVARGGGEGKSLLIVGGAGGVGSICVQLARTLTRLTVIATASRPETQAWCRELGAHHVIDHSQPMAEQLKAKGHRFVDYIFGVTHSDQHFDTIADVIAPQGKFGLIDDPKPFEFSRLKGKSASLHWEAMFTRSTFQTPDMDAQHRLLDEVAAMVDAGTIRTTLAENLGAINAANLRRAHAQVESGRMRGKLVLEGF